MEKQHKIVNKKIDDLIFAEYNPRQLSKEQFKYLKDSIHRFGLVDPVIINKNKERKNIIIGGHQRTKVAKAMGIKQVPCVELNLSYDKEKELNIRLNKNTGDWDFDLLANNFDIEELTDWGFDESELKIDLFEEEKEGLIDDDEIPEAVEPITKLGDLWKLGKHRLLCGDATLKKNIELLLDGNEIDQLLTDPPYGVDYAHKNKFLNEWGKGNRIQKEIKNDNIKDYKRFFKNFISIIPFNNYNTLYIFMSGAELHNVKIALIELDIKTSLSPYLVWVKNNHVLGLQDYMQKHEFIVYGWKNKHKFYGKKSTTILEYDKPLKNDLHPTMKPIDLLIRLIKDGTKDGMNVYDPFLGSGSTLIACEKTNRVSYGMELDPHYCDVIINRWEKFTGQKAEKIS